MKLKAGSDVYNVMVISGVRVGRSFDDWRNSKLIQLKVRHLAGVLNHIKTQAQQSK